MPITRDRLGRFAKGKGTPERNELAKKIRRTRAGIKDFKDIHKESMKEGKLGTAKSAFDAVFSGKDKLAKLRKQSKRLRAGKDTAERKAAAKELKFLRAQYRDAKSRSPHSGYTSSIKNRLKNFAASLKR